MLRKIFVMIAVFFLPSLTLASGNDDPLLTKVIFDKLEVAKNHDNKTSIWDARMFVGHDINKVWFKTEGERTNGEIESSEVYLLFSHAMFPFWDINAGIRRDLKPEPAQSWLQLGLMGTAPYFIDNEISFFIGKDNHTALRLDLMRELMLTQKWVITPEVKMDFNAYNDKDTAAGSGLSILEPSLRIKYEISREFAPYIGLVSQNTYGKTKDFVQAAGGDTSNTSVVAGVHIWF